MAQCRDLFSVKEERERMGDERAVIIEGTGARVGIPNLIIPTVIPKSELKLKSISDGCDLWGHWLTMGGLIALPETITIINEEPITPK